MQWQRMMQSRILQCDSSPPLCLSPWGTLGTELSTCPPPWAIPLAMLLAEGFAALQPLAAILPIISYLFAPCSAIMLPLLACLALPFAALQVQGLISAAVRKGKYRREGWPYGSIAATAEPWQRWRASKQQHRLHGRLSYTPALWRGGFLRVLQSTEAVCLQEIIIEGTAALPSTERSQQG